MGNCLIGGMGEGDKSAVIKVTTLNGGVMEFHTPVTAESITDEFPGHGIFQSHDLFWKPLPHSQLLTAGESYHLLPLLGNIVTSGSTGSKAARLGHVRSNSDQPGAAAPYRMSFHSPAGFTKKSAGARGFWKVKLVISPEQLMEILEEEEKTEELIESVRTVGKCGSCVNGSDEWSFCSSRNAASNSNKDAFLIIRLVKPQKFGRLDTNQHWNSWFKSSCTFYYTWFAIIKRSAQRSETGKTFAATKF
ncbi:uncharacterized protein [Primulina eburnea]|uniref:uncharacterized protein n=1 Tax=Primulina eburnea TaxID=1245227 RepID=UPI003C6BECC4